MADLSIQDIEFIKILAHSDSTTLEKGMNEATKARLRAQIGPILRQYYQENTTNLRSGWIQKFEKAGISEDEGKAAIACVRRLGIDIF